MHRGRPFLHLNLDNDPLKSYHVVVEMPDMLINFM
jgi:hypothetical protein